MNQISRRELLWGLGASALVPIVSRVPTANAQPDAPNILVVVADAMAARYMGLYGYALNNTPNLQRLAERGTVFHNHYASANFTTPGVASLLTGTYPWTHKAFGLKSAPDDSVIDLGAFQQFSQAGYHTFGFTQNLYATTVMRKLERAIDTLVGYDAWLLHSNLVSNRLLRLPDSDYQIKNLAEDSLGGWQNGSLFTAFLSDLAEVWQTQRALRREQATYPLGYPTVATGSGSYRLDDVVDGVTDTIMGLPEPFFGYVHLYPPHAPYRPKKQYYDAFKDQLLTVPNRPVTPFDGNETVEQLAEQQNLYGAFIAEMDAEFGRMMAMLEAQGKLDNTWVVFTADHGELFSNQYSGHTTELLSDDLVHVPLMVFTPDDRERRDQFEVTSCVDLLPTLLNAVGVTADERYEGSLLPRFGGDDVVDRAAFALDARRLHRNAPFTEMTSLTMRHKQYKVERYIGYDGIDDFDRLFDLENDPLEEKNIAQSKRGVAADLFDLLHSHVTP